MFKLPVLLLGIALHLFIVTTADESRREGDTTSTILHRRLGRTVTFKPSFGRIHSMNVATNCKMPNGDAICCSAFDDGEHSRGIGRDHEYPPLFEYQNTEPHHSESSPVHCTVDKIYISSPYELSQLALVKEIGEIPNEKDRFKFIAEYMWKQESIENVTRWLGRVEVHMKSIGIPIEVADDFEYLSRFVVSSQCSNGRSFQWNEWIEPITIYARNPKSAQMCIHKLPKPANSTEPKGISYAPIDSVDYIILQSGQALKNMEYLQHAISKHKEKENSNRHNVRARAVPKRILLDAGSSLFSSSTWWFACAYDQRGISFNSVHAWEYSLLDPIEYWTSVPPKWKPFVHFLNVPVGSPSDPSSPYQFIKELSPNDFVSFKLDIDNTAIEMPLALALVKNSNFTSLVDEFFFELHFNCEFMKSCGWGVVADKFNDQSDHFLLDRVSVMHYFVELRRLGIRSHMWP